MDLFEAAKRITEALAVVQGLPVSRRYTDEELAPHVAEIERIHLEFEEDFEAEPLREEARQDRAEFYETMNEQVGAL